MNLLLVSGMFDVTNFKLKNRHYYPPVNPANIAASATMEGSRSEWRPNLEI